MYNIIQTYFTNYSNMGFHLKFKKLLLYKWVKEIIIHLDILVQEKQF